MIITRAQLAVPLFLAAATVLLTHMSVKRRRRATGDPSIPAPSYIKLFLLVGVLSYVVVYFVGRSSHTGGGDGLGGGTALLGGGGGRAGKVGAGGGGGGGGLTMDELMDRIDMSEPPF